MLIARRPGLVFFSTVGFCLFLIVLISSQGLFAISDNSDFDYDIHTSEIVQVHHSYQLAIDAVTAGGTSQQGIQSQLVDKWRVTIMYKSKRATPDLLNLADLAHMKVVEDRLRSFAGYSDLCYVGDNYPNCTDTPVTLLNYADTSSQAALDTQVSTVFAPAIGSGTVTGNVLEVFFYKDFGVAATDSPYLRTVFQFGGPYKDDGSGKPFRNVKDREKEQLEFFIDWAAQLDTYVETGDASNDNVDVLYFGEAALVAAFRRIVNEDLGFAVGSLLFVFAYMCFHVGSVMLAMIGVIQIVMAFPLAFFVYRVVLGIELFQSLHVMSVFIILGIGADDVFVTVDAWEQSSAYASLMADPQKRMSYTYRRATRAMAVTSATTCGAFLATGVSQIIPISAFGFWSACLIAANYALVCSMFPAGLMLWEQHWRHKRLANCFRSCKRESGGSQKALTGADSVGDLNASPQSHSKPELQRASSENVVDTAGIVQEDKTLAVDVSDDVEKAKAVASSSSPHSSQDVAAVDGSPGVQELRAMERFFLNRWAPAIFKGRYAILIFFGIIIPVVGYFATTIQPLSQQERFFPDDHYISQSINTIRNEYRKTAFDDGINVWLVWGVAGVDKSSRDQFNPEDLGTLIWDDTFDLSPPESQLSLAKSCELLQNSTLIFKGLYTCFLDDYRTYMGIVSNLTFPYVFNATDSVDNRQQFVTSLRNFVVYWRTVNRVDYKADNSIGIDGDGILRFVSIKGLSTLPPRLPYSQTKPVYDQWQQFVEERNNDPTTPPTFNKAVQTAKAFWAFFITEQEFVSNAIRGMSISLGVALGVLLLSTRNWIISFYSMISIVAIVASVVSVMVARGQELGASESAAVVILVGFSVDYVIHLGNTFVESYNHGRRERMTDAAVQMGVSVVAGAVTTAGAGSFLFLATITFFTKFALIMTLTVVFALIYSLVFFLALLAVAGPEGDAGNISVACLRRRFGCEEKTKDTGSGIELQSAA